MASKTFGSGFHLPLNAVDQVNQPPLHFLWVQDACILSTGILWTIAYVLYIRQGFQDRSYGMPLFALCANIGWEFVYGVVFPISYAETLTFVPWVLIDCGIIYTTVKFGPEQWKHAPLVANNLVPILACGTALGIAGHVAFIKTCSSVVEAALYSGFTLQVILGAASVAQLMSRNNTSGHTWTIWVCRSIGSFLAVVMFSWRYWHYPADYPAVGSPMTIFIFTCVEIADLTYPFVFASINANHKNKLQ
ncbi:hypothetical protein JX266_008741 [Neoarthrinium moseri]|uniref:uncharacterized protein n=1 Tax=Neoarthrinium moseri TaxID=1658444 RepID=UPI001FDE1C42|nr:uncharacterized protein JN550_010186 [Neoarthrinium moseri]KAI1845194.1 hypothetical protein JX266_008741 [Neoarthrinium moseri]KAI1862661.1 hypothetical protein JN550_010186 [Neoarthrinium moseri]